MPPKPKLTPEEKKALKAQKKILKKLAKIEKKKQLKRDVLTREIKFSSVTIKKYEKEWRQLLINIALPQMRADLEFAWHNFERVIDCKDFTISLLMDELKDAEEQYIFNFNNHIENIDKLIDMFSERMEEMAAQNEKDLLELQQEFEGENAKITEEFNEEEATMKTMVHMLEIFEKEQNQHYRAEYFSKLEEEDTKNSQNHQLLKGSLEGQLSTLYTNTKNFLDNYRAQTKDRKREHDNLKVRDESMQNLLKKQLTKLHSCYEMVKQLKQQLNDLHKILGRKQKDLESEHDFFFVAFDKLKYQLLLDRELDFQKLNYLTMCYNDSIQNLERVKLKGEQILHISAVCRKLETIEEKIMPFPVSIIASNVGKDIFTKSSGDNCRGYIEELELFFQRVAQAESSRYAINEEREFLLRENQVLKMKLHRYCQCLKCPAPNKNVLIKSKHVTEGVLEYKKYEKQDVKKFVGKAHFDDDGSEDNDNDDEAQNK